MTDTRDHAAKQTPTGVQLVNGGAAEAKLTGVDLIAAERRRQIEEEGWTTEHDAGLVEDALARAAAAYATPAHLREPLVGHVVRMPALWPWAVHAWKPTPEDRVRELVKAGALIAAEIDRLRDPRAAARLRFGTDRSFA